MAAMIMASKTFVLILMKEHHAAERQSNDHGGSEVGLQHDEADMEFP